MSEVKISTRDWLAETVATAEADACIEWPFARSNGYGYFKRDGRSVGVHRFVCALTHGKPPTRRHEAAHSCGNRPCVNPHHIRWATPVENQADRLTHGTHNRGERMGQHKLTRDQVVEIRERAASGERQKAIAKDYGVTPVTVSNINTRKSWAWL